MNLDQHISEEVERYLKKEMSIEEIHSFKKKLSTIPAYMETYQAELALREMIRTKQLHNLQNKIKSDLNKPSGFSWKWLTGGLSGILVIGVLFLKLNNHIEENNILNNSNKKETSGSLTSKNFSVEDETLGKTSVIKNYSNKIITDTIAKSYDGPLNADSVVTIAPEVLNKNDERIDQHNNEVAAIDCSKNPVTVDIVTEASCKGDENGRLSIDIKSLSGGTSPFQYALEGVEDFSRQHIFSDLKSGKYIVLIKDKNACVTKITKEVGTRNCDKPIDEVFNPDLSNWKIPIDGESGGVVKIFNKAGTLVYSENFELGSSLEWNGRNENGIMLDKGQYVFLISYTNGEQKKGYISISF